MRWIYCKPCELFSYDTNEGMRAFCIVEMFLALFHIIVALSRIPVVDRWFDGWYSYEGNDYQYLAEQFWAAFTLLFMFTLICQSILGFLLYFLGWKKRNWLICLAWVICAATNFVWFWIFLIFYLCNSEGTGVGWDYHLLYLVYTIYGIWIVIGFMLGDIGRPLRRIYPNSSSTRPNSSKNPDTQV